MTTFTINKDILLTQQPEAIYPVKVPFGDCILLAVWVERAGGASATWFARSEVPVTWSDKECEEQLLGMLCVAQLRFKTFTTGERNGFQRSQS